MEYQLIAACAFGLEAVVTRELKNLGISVIKTEDGKITFSGDERTLIRANLWLRTADRIQIKLAEFQALTFEDVFQNAKKIPWEKWIPEDGRFIVNGSSVKSKLSSVPACQSVAEKGIVERLKNAYGLEHFEKTGANFSIKISIRKNQAIITLDATGPSLHKRGYRKLHGSAPLKETLAAALVQLSFWNKERILVDPCCGSGTIPIEAAMIGRNIAPGLSRTFDSEKWRTIPEELWQQERTAAFEAIDNDCTLRIYGSDIDPKAIKLAKTAAEEAGVADSIKFHVADISALKTKEKMGVMVTNPPYGERIGDRKGIEMIYRFYHHFFKENPTWSLFVITSDKTIEKKAMGREANRRRKLFNGRMEVCYYQFHGQKMEK